MVLFLPIVQIWGLAGFGKGHVPMDMGTFDGVKNSSLLTGLPIKPSEELSLTDWNQTIFVE